MSYIINIIYSVNTIFQFCLIALSYRYKCTYTIYPAIIMLIIRNNIRLLDLEGTKSTSQWEQLKFLQVSTCLSYTTVILFCFSNIKCCYIVCWTVNLMMYFCYLVSSNKDFNDQKISELIMENIQIPMLMSMAILFIRFNII